MVMGKNFEYDGLDLIELLSEEFEVRAASFIRSLLPSPHFHLTACLRSHHTHPTWLQRHAGDTAAADD
jgi:hypothetical protein